MDIVCAWCGAYLGRKRGTGTTHGICATCEEREITAVTLLRQETVMAVRPPARGATPATEGGETPE